MQDRKFFTSMAAALIFMAGITTSCVNDDVLNQDSLDGRKPISFTSSVASRSVSQTIQDTQIANGNTVGVFVTKETGKTDLHIDNQSLTADGKGGLTPAADSEPMYFPEGVDKVDIFAYTPYSDSFKGKVNEAVSFSVQADQSTEAGFYKSDLMVASSKGVATSATDAVALNFKHKLVKLNLNFSLGASDATDEEKAANKKFLQGATVSVVNVKTGATIKVSDGTVTAASEASATGITAAKFNATEPELTASVIFVPQEVKSGTVLIKVTNGEEERTAKLNQTVNFEAGKRYVYNAQLTDGGLKITTTTSVDDWEEGVISSYAIGDYLAKDGTIISKGSVTDDNKANIVAVIFSTEVSADDAKAGYTAYAMGVNILNFKNWNLGNSVVGYSTDTYSTAFKHLDGLTATQTLQNSDAYKALTEEQIKGCYVNYTSYSTLYPLPTDGSCSKWFTPSFGQMAQIFNNLGGAGLTAEMELPNNFSSSMYGVATDVVYQKINDYIKDITTDAKPMFSPDRTFGTVTERKESNLWCFSIGKVSLGGNDTTVYSWGFGRNASKSNTGVAVAPCVAIK